MENVRFGIVGSGFMGRTHAEVISRYCENSYLVAISGGSRAFQLAKDYQVSYEENVEKLFLRNDIDAVIITSPHEYHYKHGLAAAQHGKHILIEKPIGTNLQEIDNLISLCNQSDLRLMPAHTQRYRKVNQVAKDLIDKGTIGKILMVEEIQHAVKPLDTYANTESCGRLLGHGIHSPDRLRWFLNDEAESVVGFSKNFVVNSPHENSSMTIINFSKGTMASIWVTFESSLPLFPKSTFQSRIIGENGMMDIDSYGQLKLGINNEWKIIIEQETFDFQKEPLSPVRLNSFISQDQEFINSVLDNREPAVTANDGRAAVEIVLAAYESQQKQKIIKLTHKKGEYDGKTKFGNISESIQANLPSCCM